MRSKTIQKVELLSGELITIQPGDWLISRGAVTVDWARAGALDEKYDEIVEGELRIPLNVVKRIEATTGIGTAHDPYALLDAIERLASISIGTVRVEFTPGQLAEIKHRASKRGHTVEKELQIAVDRVKDEIFHRG